MIGTALYIAIAVLFFVLTFREGHRHAPRWDGYRIAGLLAAFAWPLVSLYAIYVVLSRSKDY